MSSVLRSNAEALQKLANAAMQDASKFLDAYQEQYKTLNRLEANPALRVGEIKSSNVASALDAIKVGAILNDICFVSLAGKRDALVHWLTPEGIKSVLGIDQIILRYPENPPEELARAIESHQFTIGFFMPNDDEANRLLKEVSPLIETCGVIPRPGRIFIYLKETSPSGQRTFATIETPLGEATETWDVRQSGIVPNNPSPIAIQSEPKALQSEKTLCEIVLPLVEHITTNDLALILQDEADVLVEFRSGIRQLIEEACTQDRQVQAIANDVVRPRIAKLERRFRHIVNMGRLRVGGAVLSAATLTLGDLE